MVFKLRRVQNASPLKFFAFKIRHNQNSSSPKFITFKILRVQNSSRPKFVTFKILRVQNSSHPKFVASKIYYIQNSSHSKFVASKIYYIQNSSHPKFVASKIYYIQNSSHSKFFAFKIRRLQNLLHSKFFLFKIRHNQNSSFLILANKESLTPVYVRTRSWQRNEFLKEKCYTRADTFATQNGEERYSSILSIGIGRVNFIPCLPSYLSSFYFRTAEEIGSGGERGNEVRTRRGLEYLRPTIAIPRIGTIRPWPGKRHASDNPISE